VVKRKGYVDFGGYVLGEYVNVYEEYRRGCVCVGVCVGVYM